MASLLPCLICVVLFAVSDAYLIFGIERFPQENDCARLRCWINPKGPASFDKLLQTTIYSINHEDKHKLVSISAGNPHIYVNPLDSQNVSASGHMSNYGLGLAVTLRNTDACSSGSFQCELEFSYRNGHKEVVRANVTPGKDSSVAFPVRGDPFPWDTERTGSAGHSFRTSNVQRLKKQQTVGDKCYRGMHSDRPRQPIIIFDRYPTLCDTETDGGGWILIQRRTNSRMGFLNPWNYYKTGFTDPSGDFWLGNDNIHRLTYLGYTEMRIDTVINGRMYFSHYTHFLVGDERSEYSLDLHGYSGTSGDSSLTKLKGVKFSTYDRDNDNDRQHCAQNHFYSWWIDTCSNYRCELEPPEQWVPSQCHDFLLNGVWQLSGKDVPTPVNVFPTGLVFSEIKVRRSLLHK